MTQKTVNLKQHLRAFTLGVAFVIGASSVLAQNTSTAAVNQHAGQEIGARWESSPAYQEYLKLGGEKSEKAESLKAATIARLSQNELKPYIASFEKKYQSWMDKEIKGMPVGLQSLLANLYLRLRPLLVGVKSPDDIHKFNTYLYQYVKSIRDRNGMSVANVNKMTALFPELRACPNFCVNGVSNHI